MIRTRFSPSPTGHIHIGNARAALFAALYAYQNKGVFILRIEDTDATRSEAHFTESLKENLHWLGIHWQEGPDVGGKYGPYLQSQRQPIYEKFYKQLELKRLIYPCFCSDQTLMLARKTQIAQGQAPRYSGACRKLTPQQVAARIAAGEAPAWRFIVPPDTAIEFTDVVKGPQKFQSNDIGDFIIRRKDGTAPFLFCNPIDDAEMRVSHVLRGEDHLANTPRQLMILKALNLHIPHYGHLSLIVGDDGAPLSKRHGSFSLQQIRDEGYLPIALLNYLVRLGNTIESHDLLSFEHLANYFSLEKLSRSPARFDKNQLHYWQKTAVLKLEPDEFWDWLGTDLKQKVPAQSQSTFVKAVQPNIVFQSDAYVWVNIFFDDEIKLGPEDQKILKSISPSFFTEAIRNVEKYGIDLKTTLEQMKQNLNISGKQLFMPLRVALTGKQHGPELIYIAELLGKEKMIQRLRKAERL